MLGAFLLGRLSTRANQGGVIVGVIVSLAVMIVIKFETRLAWTWYVLVGTVVCMTVGYVCSLPSKVKSG
jgi:Na+/proline symporter